jgi:hypothetical protein
VVDTRIWGASVFTHACTPNPAPFTANPKEPAFIDEVYASVGLYFSRERKLQSEALLAAELL